MERRTADHTIGVISDTHGLLRQQAVDGLKGVDHIIHAGDIGNPEILDTLRDIAPLSVVRGNTDFGAWAGELPMTTVAEVGSVSIYVIHDILGLDLDPAAAGFVAVVFGHSHRPEMTDKTGVMFLNPGAAGPKRFDLPVSIARIEVNGESIRATHSELDV